MTTNQTPSAAREPREPDASASGEFDAIVVGLGAMGACALAELARRGKRVLGVDRFAPPHDLGSSHGGSRVIRLSYFEHPDYVPLLRRAYDGFDRLGKDAGETLRFETLVAARDAFGADRLATVVRELTKMYEEVVRGTLAELAERFAGDNRGEIVLLVAGAEVVAMSLEDAVADVVARVRSGERLKEASRAVAEATGIRGRDLYAAALERSRDA
jgi:glycine/D-amino acid oxidase-like deaminating enzyme